MHKTLVQVSNMHFANLINSPQYQKTLGAQFMVLNI